MILDRVTSLADLAFRGRTNKYYRQLAILVAGYYGKSDLIWKDAIAFLQAVASTDGYCGYVVKNANDFREYCKEDFVERPEQLELTPQPQKKVVKYHDWVYKQKVSTCGENDGWYAPCSYATYEINEDE